MSFQEVLIDTNAEKEWERESWCFLIGFREACN